MTACAVINPRRDGSGSRRPVHCGHKNDGQLGKLPTGQGKVGTALVIPRAAGGNAERSMANREFHRLLYAGCGNELLVATLDGLRDRTALVSAASWAKCATWEAEAEEHEAILAAAAAGDAGTARTLTAEHVAGFLHRLP